jgi:hypothetical protein
MKSILKKYFLYLFVCFFYSTLPGHCQTNIPGGTVSGTWVLSASPYTVNGDILIPADSSLVIQAGVKIVFNGQYRLSVFGRVMAEGSASSPVSFTAGNPSTGWMGIRFDGISPLQDSSVLPFVLCNTALQTVRPALATTQMTRMGERCLSTIFPKFVLQIAHLQVIRLSQPEVLFVVLAVLLSSPTIYSPAIPLCMEMVAVFIVWVHPQLSVKIIS